MSPNWRQSPFIRISLCFLSGTGCSLTLPLPAWFMSSCLVIAVCVCLFLLLIPRRKKFRQRHVTGLLLFIILFMLGLVSAQRTHIANDGHHYLNTCDSAEVWLVRAAYPLKSDSSRTRQIAEAILVRDQTRWRPVSGKILLTGPAVSPPIMPGDAWLIRAKAGVISGAKVPFTFDYARFMQQRGVHRQLRFDEESGIALPELGEKGLMHLMQTWRSFLKEQINRYILKPDNRSILYALLLGDDDSIGRDLLNAYSASGTIHVLAVSGLHVGMIYLILSHVFQWILPKQRLRLLRVILQTLFLWTYAALTGFSPSVLRSAVMFTFFIIASQMRQQGNSINTLCASAFLLVVWDPTLLSELGFRLSYLAVGGIILLQRPVEHLIYFRNRSLRSIWKLTSVSIAAQITTLPLTIYVFHQFPTYFILSNLVIIPLSSLLLYGGLVLLVLSGWSFGAHLIGWALEYMTDKMNAFALWIMDLPASLIRFGEMNWVQFILLSLFLIYFSRWLGWKKAHALLPMMFILVLFACISILEEWKWKDRTEWLMAETREGWALLYTSGTQTHVYTDTSVVIGPEHSLYGYTRYLKTVLHYHRIQSSDDAPWIRIQAENSGPGVILFRQAIKNIFLRCDQLPPENDHIWVMRSNLPTSRRRFLINTANERGIHTHYLRDGAIVWRNDRWMPYRTWYP